MMSRSIRAVLLVLSLTCSIASAQEFERVLVPVATPGGVTGAFGSLWKSVLVVYNAGDDFVRILPSPEWTCQIGGCVIAAPPGEVYFPDTHGDASGAEFLYVEKPGNENIRFHLRVQDVSRQSLTWGTEIPVVREADGFTGPTVLVNVPLDDRFRQTLRVFGLNPTDADDVRVRIFELDGDVPLVEKIVRLNPPFRSTAGSPYSSSYAQIGWFLAEFPELVGIETVRVHVEPLTPGLSFWTFISITHNETQHVTTITP